MNTSDRSSYVPLTALDVAVASLAAFRLWRLLAEDDLPPIAHARFRFVRKVGIGSAWVEGLRCPWCAGGWIAGGVTLAALRWPAVRKALVPLAVSSLVGMLSTLDSALGRAWQREESISLAADDDYLWAKP